jgi:hypothetical protein
MANWTREEDDLLRHYWGVRDMPAKAIGEVLGGRSKSSVNARADRLGLPSRDGRPVKRKLVPQANAKPAEISLAMRRLAKFDPVIRRAMQAREQGL